MTEFTFGEANMAKAKVASLTKMAANSGVVHTKRTAA